jgi:hypothetical protein
MLIGLNKYSLSLSHSLTHSLFRKGQTNFLPLDYGYEDEWILLIVSPLSQLEPTSPLQLGCSVLSRVESTQIGVMQSDTFWESTVVFVLANYILMINFSQFKAMV